KAGRDAPHDCVPDVARARSGGTHVHARGHPGEWEARGLRHARRAAARARGRAALAGGPVPRHGRRQARRRGRGARLAHQGERPRLRTLRLLFWLRWRIGMNTTTARSRWAMVGLTAVIALALSPIYVGGAIGAYALAAKMGVAALPVVFGLCQVTVLWFSL